MEENDLARELMSGFKRLHHILHQDMHRSLETKLSVSSLFVLMRLHRAIRKGIDSLRVSELADYLGVSGSAVTQIITALEKDRLIRREMDPEDRRAIRVFLTKEGETVLSPAMRRIESHFTGLIGHLGEKDATQFLGYLGETERFFIETLGTGDACCADGNKKL